MIHPRSISATALQAAQACPARWVAEFHNRPPRQAGTAADLGTSVHGALELFVQNWINTHENWSWKQLLAYYKISFAITFGHADEATDEYKDGVHLLDRWYRRTDLRETEVVSCEIKETFPVPFTDPVTGEKGEVPLNYIWDRADKISDTEYKVVDYKTVRVPISSQALKKRIQPRVYALAAQIKWPDAEVIWVEYDLLRHEAVGARFTRDDQVNTWRFIKHLLKTITEIDEDAPLERLNPDCGWCVRKRVCETLNSVTAAGSVVGINPDEAAVRKLEVASQIKALTILDAELDAILVAKAENEDRFGWATDLVQVEITASRRRNANSAAIAKIIGPELMTKYGNVTVTNVDKLLRDPTLTEDQRAIIKQQIGVTYGEPTAKVLPLDPFTED